jgi:hypothetical protein
MYATTRYNFVRLKVTHKISPLEELVGGDLPPSSSQRLTGMVMVFKATFNNISVILWRSVLLVEKTGENHRPAASHWQTWSHNVVMSTPAWVGFALTTLVVIGTDCIGSCKCNYDTITATTTPVFGRYFSICKSTQFLWKTCHRKTTLTK